VLHTIPRDIYGINMAAWTGLNNAGEATYEARMKAAGVTQIRWPGGSWADILDWSNIQCQGAYDATTDQAIAFMATFGGKMQPIVNFSGNWCGAQHTHAQAVTLAASWVTYMNVTHAYATKVWEVGNEDYGSWEQGNTDGTTYGSDFADYYTAMKAVDPTIQIGAVASPGAGDYNGWTGKVLTAAKAKGVTPDFLIVHVYPYNGTPTGAAADAAILANVGQVAGWTKSLNQIVTQALGASYVGKIRYRMTEYGGPLSPTPVTVEYVEAMFDAQLMMELALNGWAGANKWNAKNGGGPTGDWGFLDVNSNTPRPDYYVFPILSGKFGASQVSAVSANGSVRSYAAKDGAGNLTLFLVNNDPTTDIAATVNVIGFNAAATGTKWVLLPAGTAPAGAPQEANGLQINGVTNPDPASLATLPGLAQPGTNAFTVDLPPSAMVMVVLPPA
jgi:alpha-L-arabinofuranosidase